MASFVGAGSGIGGIAGGNAVARLLVIISGDSTPLQSALAKAEGGIGGLSKNASSIGNALTRSLSLPLLALGGIAVHAASNFESAIGRVAGLTPIIEDTGKSVETVREEILKLAQDPQITAGPTDLADALFLAGSAGLDAGTAMDVVKLSAQGMSVGMGDATDISKVLIAALNNYKSTGLTAAHAMDVFTVAVKDGTAAPDELSIALGRLLPVAAAAGVSIEAVAGSVAALTNLGVPTRVATTSLRALFSELLAPTEAAKKKLDEFGVSATQLRDTLATNGPIAAFDLLQRAVRGNVEALHDIIPQIRGFTAFLGLTGKNAHGFKKIMDDMSHSTGAFKRALDIVSQTPEFKFQKGLQSLQIAAIKVGEDLIPVFEGVAQVFQTVGEAIGNLSGPMTELLAVFILVGSALGPVVKLFGNLTSAVSVANSAAGRTTATWQAMATGFVAFAISAAVAVGSFESLARGGASFSSVAISAVSTIFALRLALGGLQAVANSLNTTNLGVAIFADLSGGELVAIAAAIGLVVTAIGFLIGSGKDAAQATTQMGDSFLESAKSGETLGQALQKIEDKQLAAEMTRIAKAAGLMGRAMGAAFKPLEKAIGARLIGDLKKLADGSIEFTQSLGGTDQVEKFIAAIQEAVDTGRDLGPVLKENGFSSEDFSAAMDAATTATLRGGAAYRLTALDAERLALAYAKSVEGSKKFQDAELASIVGTEAESAAIQRLASQTGLSADQISSMAQKYQIQISGANETVLSSFLKAGFGVDESGKKITQAALAASAAIQQTAADMSKSLTDAFTLFGDLPKAIGTSIDHLITKAQQFANIAVQEGAAVRTLMERGVPAGLIQQFIDQGPRMVTAFADATTPQLNRVINAYEVGLGALDQSILDETKHQEGKGKNMVQRFATAILSANNIPRAAGVHIVESVVAGLNAGNIKPAALDLVITFVHALNSAKGLSKAEGVRAAIAFADGIASGDYVGPKGKLLAKKAADGISQNAGIPKAAAVKLVGQVAGGIDSGKHKVLASAHKIAGGVPSAFTDQEILASAKAAGAKFTSDFTKGMTSNLSLVDAAAAAIAARAKTALDKALQNSPYYFSLPMGRKLVTDLYVGAEGESRKHSADADRIAKNISGKFRQAFLDHFGHYEDLLSNLQSIVKDNMKKAFDAGDLEAVKGLQKTEKHIAEHLDKLHQRFTDFRTSIRDAFSDVLDFGSTLTDAWKTYQDQLKQYAEDMKQFQSDMANFNPAEGGTAPIAPIAPTAPDFSALIREQVANAQRLASDLSKAAKAGLSQGLLQQFATQGVDAAPILEQLLANPDLIAQLNDAFASVKTTVGKTVDQLGEHYFGKAIQHAIDAVDLFSRSVIKVTQDLVRALGDSHKKLLEQLQNALDAIKKQAASLPTGSGGGQGNGGGQGPGGNGGIGSPWGGGPFFPGPNNPNLAPYRAPQMTGTSITVAGDINVHGMNDPVHAARQIQSELIKIGKSNAGKLGLTDK